MVCSFRARFWSLSMPRPCPCFHHVGRCFFKGGGDPGFQPIANVQECRQLFGQQEVYCIPKDDAVLLAAVAPTAPQVLGNPSPDLGSGSRPFVAFQGGSPRGTRRRLSSPRWAGLSGTPGRPRLSAPGFPSLAYVSSSSEASQTRHILRAPSDIVTAKSCPGKVNSSKGLWAD